ncbi:MAG: mannonate dehydratase, partial [Clostridiaceae bacterium]|nr:mannonate dehydratase [Clostridiaceae bacterium]
MKMIFRWFGSSLDPIPLRHIRQIPKIRGIAGSLMDIPVGETWPTEEIASLKQEVNDAGLEFEVIESVNVHEDIKLGIPSRDRYIENYIETIKNLGKLGIKVICYNFMPIFDWTRSDLAKELSDGSNVLSYDARIIDRMKDVKDLAKKIEDNPGSFKMPGWEPERIKELRTQFSRYEGFTEDDLFNNLKYFLESIIPTCEAYDVKMAIHPDDPPWSIFGIPRIANSKENLDRILSLVDSKHNGLTLCSGSLGADQDNKIPDLIRHFGKDGKIHFAHIRNIRVHEQGIFDESSHLSEDGSLDIYEIMKAYDEIGFEGYVRPDHGRMIWDEQGRAGYGLYDRALGVAYMNGLWEAIKKSK